MPFSLRSNFSLFLLSTTNNEGPRWTEDIRNSGYLNVGFPPPIYIKSKYSRTHQPRDGIISAFASYDLDRQSNISPMRSLYWNKQLSLYSTVLLEELSISKLAKQFSTVHGNSSFFTVFTRARHWSLSQSRWIWSTLSCSLSLFKTHFNIILQPMPGFSKCSLQFLRLKFCIHFSSIPCVLHAPFILSSSIWSPL
jgi:hypothetical protein